MKAAQTSQLARRRLCCRLDVEGRKLKLSLSPKIYFFFPGHTLYYFWVFPTRLGFPSIKQKEQRSIDDIVLSYCCYHATTSVHCVTSGVLFKTLFVLLSRQVFGHLVIIGPFVHLQPFIQRHSVHTCQEMLLFIHMLCVYFLHCVKIKEKQVKEARHTLGCFLERQQ